MEFSIEKFHTIDPQKQNLHFPMVQMVLHHHLMTIQSVFFSKSEKKISSVNFNDQGKINHFLESNKFLKIKLEIKHKYKSIWKLTWASLVVVVDVDWLLTSLWLWLLSLIVSFVSISNKLFFSPLFPAVYSTPFIFFNTSLISSPISLHIFLRMTQNSI